MINTHYYTNQVGCRRLSSFIQLSCLKKIILMFSRLEDFHFHFSVWEFHVLSWQFWFLCMYRVWTPVKQNQTLVNIHISLITDEIQSTVIFREWFHIALIQFIALAHIHLESVHWGKCTSEIRFNVHSSWKYKNASRLRKMWVDYSTQPTNLNTDAIGNGSANHQCVAAVSACVLPSNNCQLLLTVSHF